MKEPSRSKKRKKEKKEKKAIKQQEKKYEYKFKNNRLTPYFCLLKKKKTYPSYHY